MQAARAVAQGKADRGLRDGRSAAGSSPDNRALRSGGQHIGSVRCLLCGTNALMQAIGYVRPQNAAWSAENLAGRGLGPRPTYLSNITEWRRFCGRLSKEALCKPGAPQEANPQALANPDPD